MKQTVEILRQRISNAITEVTGIENCDPIVRLSTNPDFGDYQANGVMAIAKKTKTNPRKLAEEIIAKLSIEDICSPAEVAGPGFINLRLKPEFISKQLMAMEKDLGGTLGFEKTKKPQTIVVDFSGPNIAKQMHVGHLRSTIIGDSICRILESIGHKVIKQNHIGDWGTQFGMLIAYLKQDNPEVIDNPDSVHLSDLEQFYKNAKARCDEDADFAEAARKEVIKLHNKDADTMRVWQHIVDESRLHYQPTYDRLKADLHQENERGESFYADKLESIVEDLRKMGLAKESDGAICVFPDGFKNKEGNPLPLIIRKSDGAFLYATTDLAAIRYRADELKADKIIYVTDARQNLHFEMVFAVARMAGWVKEDTELCHVTFGSVLGEDGKPFKTRSGENVKLKDLLDGAVTRALSVVEEKNPELDAETKSNIAKAVGIGAVKYADYSNNRTSDYIFSFDKMLAMEGNTAPYMQYAYARVKSISRKAKANNINIENELAGLKDLNLVEPAEIDLAKYIMSYGEIINAAAVDYRMNYLTAFLYELAQKFSSFYTNCPVLKASDKSRATRLLLCRLTAKCIGQGLSNLLGIDVVEQM